ncbi:hypothetical protein NHF46_16450 [Arthrobacter alpinus]|nr:hypothetical protein [Arthrobacter alpinus]
MPEHAIPEAFVFDAIRTPRGRGKKGSLHGTKPIDLVVGLINALRERNPGLDGNLIDDLILGVVSPWATRGRDRPNGRHRRRPSGHRGWRAD